MIREWWQNLGPRDQKFLISGGIIALILLIYAFIWSPLSTAVSGLKQQVDDQRELLGWLQAASTKTQQYHNSGFSIQNRGNQPLITFLSNSLANNDLHQFNPQIISTTSDTVTINFNQVAFDNLIAWLEKLWRNYGQDLEKISITTTPISGLVKAQLVITK
ncbi:MAG: type II secretion system protein GspM [Gammaproteobacteria bacterium]